MLLRRFSAVVLLSIFIASPGTVLSQVSGQPVPGAPAAPQTQEPARDPNDPISKIREEGLKRSQVMQTLSYLTDVIGPRLTASPGMKRANEWTRDQLTKWGLQNARLESWGPFGRGWTLKTFSAQVVEPQAIPLIAYPKAWSTGFAQPITAEVVYLDAKTEADLEKYKGKLKGKIVLTAPTRDVAAHFDAQGTRLNEKDLLALADAPEPRAGGNRPGGNFRGGGNFAALQQFNNAKLRMFHDDGVALLVDPGRGDGGTIFVQSAAAVPPPPPAAGGTPVRPPSVYDRSAPAVTPQVVIAIEQYNRIVRMLQANETVKMTVDLKVAFQDTDLMGYNTIAEIPGTDLKDEVVMLGGHMDSWHSGTGATDNGAGVSVAMEAVRIIQALGLKPRRTIRVALWSGEEQGLLGSRAYVGQHFGSMQNPATSSTSGSGNGTGMGNGNGAGNGAPQGQAPAMVLVKKPEWNNLSAYFNLDNGTGKIRGVYLQGNEAVRPLFRQWLAPFRDLGATTLSISNTGGTDHLAFDGVGLPGFQFIQDEIEYDTRTHHSNQDTFDRIQAEDMKQAATIMAAFVYNTAMLNEKLPRKPAPGSR